MSPQRSVEERLVDSTKNRRLFMEKFVKGELEFGDTLLPTQQYNRFFRRQSADAMRKFDVKMRWKDAVVPYTIDCSLG